MIFWVVKCIVTIVFGIVMFDCVVLLHGCGGLLFLESGFAGLWGFTGLGRCWGIVGWMLDQVQYDGPREMWVGDSRFLALLGMTQ